MKRVPLLILTFAVVASFAWLVGCSSVDDAGNGELSSDELMTRVESENLNDSYGGYNMKDDQPAFDDPDLVADLVEDADYNDPFASDRDVANLEQAQRGRTMLMITWGNLHRDEGIDFRTNWDGSLSVDPGVILLKKAIRFEPQDQILPRTQRDLLEWESNTSCCIDGILVRILAKPQLSTAAVDSGIDSSMTVIKFETGPLTVEFTLDQLPGLNRIVTLDDGNAVAFQAITIEPGTCPRGFMHGRWMNHPERQGGFLKGRWETENGGVKGHMKGIYGVNDAGDKVFFGKMISRSGRFLGIVVGHYDKHPDDENGGWFQGRIVNRNREIIGGIKGEWKRSEHCNGGLFRARWGLNCNVDTES